MKHMTRFLPVLLAGAVFSLSVAAAGQATPEFISLTCYACHGTNGASAGPIQPTIGGQQSKYMFDTLKRYQSGERPSTVMGRLMQGYSDDEIKAIADHFSKLPFVAADHQPVDPAKVERGRELHAKNCKKCHIDNGRDYAEGAGIIGGQWLPFLKMNFDEYRAGKRKMPEKMKEKMDVVSAEDCEALAHFYAAQKH